MKLIKTIIIGCFLLSSYYSKAQLSVLDTIANGDRTLRFSSFSLYELYADQTYSWKDISDVDSSSTDLKTLAEIDTSGISSDNEYPDFLKLVLNSDSIFSVSHYLIKIDMPNLRALVVDNNRTNAYDLIKTNQIDSTGVIVFNDDVQNAIDVMEQIENGSLAIPSYLTAIDTLDTESIEGFCRRARGHRDDGLETWYFISDRSCRNTGEFCYNGEDKLVYQKSIFYFSLIAKRKSKHDCCDNTHFLAALSNHKFKADLQLIGTVKYKKRCGSEQNVVMNKTDYDDKIEWRPYSDGRSLSHYDFNITFYARFHPTPSGPIGPFLPSRAYRIMDGY